MQRIKSNKLLRSYDVAGNPGQGPPRFASASAGAMAICKRKLLAPCFSFKTLKW